MKILLENTKQFKRVDVDVPDQLIMNPEDVSVIIGTERFKLVSTKTKEEKEREQLSSDFGHEFFPKWSSENKTELTDDELKKLVSDNLTGKYEVLNNDTNRDIVLPLIVNAYKQYCMFTKKMQELDEEIATSTTDSDPCRDYVNRLKNAIASSTSLKELVTSVSKIRDYAKFDTRGVIYVDGIFNCIQPIIKSFKAMCDELKEMKPSKSIQEQTYWTDTEQWKSMFVEEKAASIANLDALANKFNTLKESTECATSKFEFYLNEFINIYAKLVKPWKKYIDARKADNDAKEIEKYRTEFKNASIVYFEMMPEIELREHFDCRKYGSEDEYKIVSAQFAQFAQISEVLKNSNNDTDFAQVTMILNMHYNVLLLVQNGKLDIHKLLTNQYTQKELEAMVSEFNKQ